MRLLDIFVLGTLALALSACTLSGKLAPASGSGGTQTVGTTTFLTDGGTDASTMPKDLTDSPLVQKLLNGTYKATVPTSTSGSGVGEAAMKASVHRRDAANDTESADPDGFTEADSGGAGGATDVPADYAGLLAQLTTGPKCDPAISVSASDGTCAAFTATPSPTPSAVATGAPAATSTPSAAATPTSQVTALPTSQPETTPTTTITEVPTLVSTATAD